MEFAEIIVKPRVDNVFLIKPLSTPLEGSLAITGHHLIFSPSRSSRSEDVWLLQHKNVDLITMEVRNQSPGAAHNSETVGILSLKCKNFLIAQLEFFQSLEDCQYVAKVVEFLANLTDVKLHYPFFYKHSVNFRENGWEAFSVEHMFAALQTVTDRWRISYVNQDYSVCPTYPSAVIVPKPISDDVLRISAQFREGNRFPVLSYYHKETKSIVARCSQPLIGPGNKRCKEDEQLLNAMLSTSNRGYIIDTRSTNAAQAAKQKGGGFEPETSYPLWKRVHKSTVRWQNLQESLAKLIDACSDCSMSSDKWISRLNNSGWLQGVCDALTAACVAAQCIDREGEKAEMSVVIHGGASVDSTLLISSLVQVILDPDCRTLRGFEALIEREWVLAGHPFASRCAHAAFARNKGVQAAEAPTFLMFLDCVWQIHQQFCCSFEFTESFLIYLFENAYASEFGTFLCNNERERKDFEVKTQTVSLWSHLNRPEVLQQYINSFYEPNKGAVWPSVAPQSIVLWQKLYCRWNKDWSVLDAVWNTLVGLRLNEKKAIANVTKLRRQLADLEFEAKMAGVLPGLAMNN